MREINLKKFLSATPEAREDKHFTLWAASPDKVPMRVRRAADVYRDIATQAHFAGEPKAQEWAKIATILERAAADLEAVFAATA